MKNLTLSAVAAAVAIATAGPAPAIAADNLDALRRTVETLQKQLQEVQQQLKAQEEKSASKEEVEKIRKEVASASEWKEPNTLIHMAGYADVDYMKKQGEDGSFTVGSFSPIFHFQYRDLVMLESELEFEVADTGETEVGLEYLTIDLFLNDYATLVAGKFLSPIGQFRQNLHPSWINKMASAPPGFGHDGAAPVSDTGLQLRGGFPIAGVRTNYAVYAGNGPELNAETGDGVEFELEGVRAEGFGADNDGEIVYGGRFGILPVAGLEVGLSGLTGKATVTELEVDPSVLTPPTLASEGKRDYDVFGADFNLQYRSFGLRGEYVKTRVGSTSKGTAASPGARWTTWYTQASYRFLPTKWEAVLRYTDFDSAVDLQDQTQWGVGINYLFTNNFIAKLNYEFNDNDLGSEADDNRVLGQLAYGF